MVARLHEFDIFSIFVLTATVIATRQGIRNEIQMKYHHGLLCGHTISHTIALAIIKIFHFVSIDAESSECNFKCIFVVLLNRNELNMTQIMSLNIFEMKILAMIIIMHIIVNQLVCF